MHSDNTSIPGWLMDPDPAVIRFILGEQDTRGDLLEIGCNLGKTAVLLGDYLREDETLCVSDLFLFPRHGYHTSELGLAAFKANYAKWHRKPPEVHCGPNHDADWGGDRFRLVHIDGDHSYDAVALDIADSLGQAKAHAVVIVDDYCCPDYPGVAAAAWEAVNQKRLFPFAATGQKLYCTLSPSYASTWQSSFLTKSPWRSLGRQGIHPDSENGVDNTTVYSNPIMIIPSPEIQTSRLKSLAKRLLRW